MTQKKRPGDDTAGLSRLSRIDQATLPPIQAESAVFGSAPTFMSATSPPLKIIRVGMERTPNWAASSGFSSMLSLAIFTLPPSSVAISSSDGAIILQGPHHSAQKSTTTGSDDWSTSAWKLFLSTFWVAMDISFELRCRRCGCGGTGIQAALFSRSRESGKGGVQHPGRQRHEARRLGE